MITMDSERLYQPEYQFTLAAWRWQRVKARQAARKRSIILSNTSAVIYNLHLMDFLSTLAVPGV
jgi:hypothetical protein